jgi:hypothetical protein
MTKNQLKEYIKQNIKEILSEDIEENAKTKPTLEENSISKEAIQKKYNEMFGKDPNTTFAKVAKALGITEPEIAQALFMPPFKLEEMSLKEMANPLKKGIKPSEKIEPRYKKENYKKVVDLILSKVDGEKTMADIARELGVVQQKIRPVVADLISVGILEKGESKSGKNTDNKPNPKEEAPKKETPKKEAPKKEKKVKDEDEEEVEDNWNKSSDDDGMEDEKSIDKKAQAAAKKGGSNLTKLNNITTQLKDLEKEMKAIADNYKKAEGSKKETLLSQLKEKTKTKKELEKLQDKLAADVV